jgi:hypothetical protein
MSLIVSQISVSILPRNAIILSVHGESTTATTDMHPNKLTESNLIQQQTIQKVKF